MSSITRLSVFITLFTLLALQGALQAATLEFLPWDGEVATRKLGLQRGDDVTELKALHPHKRSGAYTSSGDGPLFLVAMDRRDDEGKLVSVPLRIQPGIKSPLVLVVPDEKNSAGVRPVVIEDDPSSFSWGSVRFVNATGKALIVRHENTVKKLSKSWDPVEIKPGGRSRNVGVQMAAQEDTHSILYSAVWEHDPNVRKLVFIVPGTDVRTGFAELKIITEDRRVLALEEESKAP